MSKPTAIARLLSKIDTSPVGCWPWKASLGRWGYGSFYLYGRNINASRAAYLLLVGPIGKGLCVCHSCDNPACCRPGHLWLGTPGQNVRDCNQKHRARGTFQSATHPRHTAKLTRQQIKKARDLFARGVTQTEIGRRFGIHSSAISRAIRGETFKNLA